VIAACSEATGLVVEPGTTDQQVATLTALGLALVRG